MTGLGLISRGARVRRGWKLGSASVVVAVVLTGVSACSNDNEGSADSDSSAPGKVIVDAPPSTSSAAAFVGASNGDFTKAGLKVTMHAHQSADSPIVGLLANQYPIVWTTAADVLGAFEKRLPLSIVALSDLGQPGQLVVLVKDGSPIQGPKDLAGKKIAIPGPTSGCAVTLPAILRDAGVDPATVKLVPVAQTDHGSTLQRGITDAVCTSEPFQSMIKQADKVRVVVDDFSGDLTDTLVGVYVTTTSYAAKHPAAIKAFREGLQSSAKNLNGDQVRFRAAIPTFTQTDASLAAKMALPKFAEDVVDPAPLNALAKLMKSVGMLKSADVPSSAIAK